MSTEKDIQAVLALLEKLQAVEAAFRENESKKPPKPKNFTARIINLTRAKAFCTDPEKIKIIEAEITALERHFEPDVINVPMTAIELYRIMQGLDFLASSYNAKQYVKESLWKKTSREERWSKVAELMLIKDPDETLSKHGDDEFCMYWGLIMAGLKPKKASEEVFKKFKFQTQGACDKWLQREVKKRKFEMPEIYGHIRGPGTYPRE